MSRIPQSNNFNHALFYRYDILYFILTYMVPIVAMGVSYGHIGRVLWGRKNFTGEAAATSEAHERKLASKRKVRNSYWRIDEVYDLCASLLVIHQYSTDHL